MVCEACNGPIGLSRDPICLGCAAVNTIQEELKAEWPSASLRNLGADLLVSCSRHLRAFRLTSLRAYAEAEEKGRLEERAARRREEEGHGDQRRDPAVKAEEESYSYSEEEEEARPPSRSERSGTPAGITAKSKAGPTGEGKGRRDRTDRSSDSERVEEPRGRREPREALPRAGRGENRNLVRAGRHHDEGTTPRKRRHKSRQEDTAPIQLHQRHLVLQDERLPVSRKPPSQKKWRRT